MKKIALFMLVVFCLGLTACSKDAEVNAFVTENRAVIEDIVKKVDADPSEKGVEEAQKSFDAKKASLKEKWEAIKNARKAQVSADVQKKLDEEVPADMKKLTEVQMKHFAKLGSGGNAKFGKLLQDYQDIIKM